ncbi:sensor histidine kinase [Sphingomonas sp. So64.6b]|uniref:sensor histidine kinase n=1 Tax=Sphingomonas sp. So64.6b TaxID=2997354 RepID=UPI0016017937|nr:ATP-binding protein [Sphingomonas sp. So64.6b]QNA82803.1 sensor histidine kinase [Sphingomonas sp. So64.6b]
MTRFRTPRFALILALLLIGAAALILASGRWALGEAERHADTAARQTANVQAGLLASELQKFRLLPLVLIDYPDVATMLDGGDAATQQRLNGTLELFAHRTDAAAIYVIDAQGRTRAASNWRLPTSFVGQNYAFRPYFRDAMRAGGSELFALGTVSGRPGLFLARRVDRGGRALGTVVVKVEFDRVEQAWAHAGGISFVTDPHGVILITSRPDWRFRTTHALDAATLADARRTLQFGAKPPVAAPLSLGRSSATVPLGDRTARYRVARSPAALSGAVLVRLEPLEPALAAATTRARLWGVAILLLVGLAAGFFIRAADTRRLQNEARVALEKEVAHRTVELRDANARLTVESHERIEADHRFRAAREELAQANRLGSIGQITAGVAHEINQPVAAIRTFAENAVRFLDRGAPDTARGNLDQIVGLTARIGTITAELRSFARRRTPATGAVPIASVIDGALLLIGEQARRVIAVDLPPSLRDVTVVGDRVRLEQVLINLLQNALDAVETMADRHVSIRVTGDTDVQLAVTDNGGGIDPGIADTLFTPFASSKPEGLGLGLAIARDIAREFGGDVALSPPSSPTGATFLFALRRA